MIRFRCIEIENFVCFDDAVIEPSTDPDRPLTVIRAENGSGKTTLLRAILWGMYGEDGLPGEPHAFPLHLADWEPDEAGMQTTVKIEFENDGSTRYDPADRGETKTYQLIRQVTTVKRQNRRSNQPIFRREHENKQLMVRSRNGRWEPHEHGVDTVVEALLPKSLRDFFVMDADQVTDFVGGGENKQMQRREVIRITTDALRSLLGLGVFRDASQRLDQIARQFGSQASRAIGDAAIEELQTKLERLRAQKDKLEESLRIDAREKADAIGRKETCEELIGEELAGTGKLESLNNRKNQINQQLATLEEERGNTVGELCLTLESGNLLANLAMREISRTYEFLRPLHEQGRIPQRHLAFVEELLREGECICGQDLRGESRYRRRVAAKLTDGREHQDRADYLGSLFESVRSLRATGHDPSWMRNRERLTKTIGSMELQAQELKLEKRDIDGKLSKVDDEKIQQLRAEKGVLENRIEKLNQKIGASGVLLPELNKDIDSVEKKISQRKRTEGAAKEKRQAEELAKLIRSILDGAYFRILDHQVEDLSKRMNQLFARMAENVTDDEIEDFSESRATLKMITRVGIRLVEDDEESFEIFALNKHGRFMPPTEINGASRRVIALSFVLALCKESQTDAPLVADSLLNFMSGTVRRNTLRTTAELSSQPVLLLTGSDLESPSEIETVTRYAGATYTLTAQWHAKDAGSGGDVLTQTKPRSVSILCKCGPRDYCQVCEREGQANAPGWLSQT